MRRLSNRILQGSEHAGALGPIGAIPNGLISFDDALVRAWAEDPQAATSVQVTLGSADPAALHWESSSRYFYVITWSGVCLISIGGGRIHLATPEPCFMGDWGTVIDASNGAFIVGGNG